MKVSELIEKLKAMPQDATVVVDDADTGWYMHIKEVGQDGIDHMEVVVFDTDYDEVFHR